MSTRTPSPEQELLAREPLLYYVGHVEPVGVQQFLLQPLPERVLAGVAFLEFVVAYNAPLGGVHREHVAGLQPPFFRYVRRVDIDDAHFGGEDHMVVPGDVIARRTQAVSIQNSA